MDKVIIVTKSELDVSYYEEFKLKIANESTILHDKFRINLNGVVECHVPEMSSVKWKNSPQITVTEIISGKYEIIKLPQKPFWAKDGDKFYFIYVPDGDIFDDEFDETCDFDLMKRKLGNCFKTNHITKEQIETYIKNMNNGTIL